MNNYNVWNFVGAFPDDYIPEHWAYESLRILRNNMIMANLVHRDFEDEIAQYGDVVNTRLPAEFTAYRKTRRTAVTEQEATSTNVAVPLDQWFHTTFILDDSDMSKSFKDLVTEFLEPAILSLAQSVDQLLCNQVYHYLDNGVGSLGTAATASSLVSVREKFNENKVPMMGRMLVTTTGVDADLLKIDTFTEADKVGDDGTALREGYLGRKYGIDIFMDQNMPHISSTYGSGSDYVVTTTLDDTDGTSVGDLTCRVESATGLSTGMWFTIAGDMIPHIITAVSGNDLTFYPAIKTAPSAGATLTAYKKVTINESDGYSSGNATALDIDTPASALSTGQMVTVGTTSAYVPYGLIQTPTATSILLDRPLAADIDNDATMGVGPVGEYNFAFNKNALAFVNRPLYAPPAGTGVRSATVNTNGLSIRLTMGYDTTYQGLRITADLLCGVKVLDENLGVVLFA